MSNPARDLLNYVDDHKTEMKDDTYKGIVDRLAPINKSFEDQHATLYKARFLISDLDDTDDGGEVSIIGREFKVYLTEDEAKQVNQKLELIGFIRFFFHFNLKKHKGIHSLSELRDSLIKPYNKVTIDIDVNANDSGLDGEYKKLPYFYSNEACLVRITKV